jgi:NADH-quinone oxidoreductase subunit E
MSHGTVMPVDAPATLVWPEKLKGEVADAISRYPAERRRSAVMPLLWLAQREWGWLPPAALRLVADSLGLNESEVYGVATFYTMFNLQPVGRHHLQVCMTLSCSLMGADRLYAHLEKKLGIGHTETTADGRFTLRKVECLAACGKGPCMQVGFDYHENLDEAKVDSLLEKLK